MLTGDDEGLIRVWSVPSGSHVPSERESFSFPAHAGPVVAITFSRNGLRFATGGGDGMIKLWSRTHRRLRAVLRGHRDWVTAQDGADDTTLVSGGGDRSIKYWDAKEQGNPGLEAT